MALRLMQIPPGNLSIHDLQGKTLGECEKKVTRYCARILCP